MEGKVNLPQKLHDKLEFFRRIGRPDMVEPVIRWYRQSCAAYDRGCRVVLKIVAGPQAGTGEAWFRDEFFADFAEARQRAEDLQDEGCSVRFFDLGPEDAQTERVVRSRGAGRSPAQRARLRAAAAWGSLSAAQARLLSGLRAHGWVLRRRGSMFDACAAGGSVAVAGVAHLRTVRALAARGLIDWDGGAFDPEAAAVLSDRGRFVADRREAAPPA